MNSNNQIRISSIVGMSSAGFWLIALFIEYRFGLLPPGNGSWLYNVDQVIFFLALAGYLILLLGLWKSKAVGNGTFGKISLGIFIAALVALIIAWLAQLVKKDPNFFLYPIGGILQLLGGLLTGIAIVTAKRWNGWQRFAPLLQGLYYLILFILLVVGNSQNPSPAGEGLWQVTWFLTSLALFTKSNQV